MIPLKYIRLYFLARFNSIFCIRINQKIGLLHLASTNLFSLSQKKRFFNGIKVNNLNPSCLMTLYNIRIILYLIFLFHISSTLPFTEMFTFRSKIQQMCRSKYQRRYSVSPLIQRYSVSSSVFPFLKTDQLINRHNSISSSFPTNNHLITSSSLRFLQ